MLLGSLPPLNITNLTFTNHKGEIEAVSSNCLVICCACGCCSAVLGYYDGVTSSVHSLCSLFTSCPNDASVLPYLTGRPVGSPV